MASFSSSSAIPQRKYDVFLSFRGEDTRGGFTGHLYKALLQKNIETFIDNQLIRGNEISQSLLNAIEGSTISIIIFSKQYASSRWCLDELRKILECKSMYGQIVIPIFYHVDPSHVRNQTGPFGDSFLKLEELHKERSEKLQKWRIALKEAASLSGFNSYVIGSESELIEKIVQDILKKLKNKFSSDFNKDFVGVESRIEEIESLLSHKAMGVYTLGIWGMGGIGKTTIADAFFNKVSSQFDGSFFISNIREESEKIGGLTQLRRELFFTLSCDGNLNTRFHNFGFDFEIKRLGRKKVLIVFDDVTYFNQIEFLIGGFDRLMQGSLIIVTTRDKRVLKNCGVKIIYKMEKIVDVDALKLFSWHAFRQSHLNASYERLSNKVMQYSQGVPLVLKVLGCFLYGRSKTEWESEINKLESIPCSEIQKVLKVSYDSLDDLEKRIFLDIACFLKGEDKDLAVKFLDASDLFAEIGLSVLIERSLIIITDNKVTMHDLLQEMGREIVRQESVDYPENRSRLWNHKDVYEVLTYNLGTQVNEGIYLNMNRVDEINLSFETFKQMRNLRFLKFDGKNKFKICDLGGEGYIFRKLRYLYWKRYPLKSLPSSLRAENLVFLKLRRSKIQQLWDGVQNLVNVKEIDLKKSKWLTELPNLSKAQNLENLNLLGCSRLVEIHSSIQYLNKLLSLRLEDCQSLKTLPSNLFNLKSLKFLNLSNCSNLKSLPEITSCNLVLLYLGGTAIDELPSSIEYLSKLWRLDLSSCSRLNSLPSSLCKLKSLQNLFLNGCSNLQRLPEEIGNLDSLWSLKAEKTAITEVPSSIKCLKKLTHLCLERLHVHEQMGFGVSLEHFRRLSYLKLIDCDITALPKSLFKLFSLKVLVLDKNKFVRLPKSIIHLSKLETLSVNDCKRLQSLSNLPSSLLRMEANRCSSLEALSGLSILSTIGPDCPIFSFRNCFKLDQNELKKIVNNSLRKIQLLPTGAWKNEFFYDGICYPGSEIPEFFKFQSMGSSLEMPPGVQFNSVPLGFLFCLIVSFKDHRERHVFGKCKIETKWVRILSIGRIGSVKSDHVILGYKKLGGGSKEFFYNNKAFFKFYQAKNTFGKRMECCEMVKKCGIHLLYAHDFGESAKITAEVSALMRKRKDTWEKKD